MITSRRRPRRRPSLANRRPVTHRPRLETLEDRIVPSNNPIVAENQLPGTPESTWGVGAGDSTIQGFATDISVNHGQTVSFKVNDSALAPYHIDIYRLGYYQGNGAHLVTTIPSSQALAQSQPAALTDQATGLVDAGNWSVSASWAVPSTATSGLYMARLAREDTGGASSVFFVVRADESTSDLLFQTSDSTWQAYNKWGGNSLYSYSGTNSALQSAGRAYKVSYNRPLTLDAQGSSGSGDYSSPLHAEYPMIRFLESNGYNVSYTTDVDSDRNGSLLLNHKAFMSVGHDEYWSGAQRANVTAARDAGVNLAFFSGNESFWKTRWESSLDTSATSYRTLVCYKESKANARIDPLDVSPTWTWTGSWRDPRFSPPSDGGKPENALSGVLYMDDRTDVDLGIPMTVPSSAAALRFWRNTAVGNHLTATVGQYVVGYEVDQDVDNGSRPAGLIDLSATSFATQSHVIDVTGEVDGPGLGTSNSTLYRAASGALVFAAGTVQWSWGLDNHHNDTATATADASLQQATVNLLADMHAQPDTLQGSLVAATASTDATPPASTITAPSAGAGLTVGSPVTITGTAADAGGGVVAGVEVSVDGGATWHPAVGQSSWRYTWVPNAAGQFTIRTRAVDDSCNLETPSAGVTVTVSASSTVNNATIWAPTAVPGITSANDNSSLELGLKFRSDVAGYVTGVRFYKGAGNTGAHVAHLWTATGTQLASATASSETASGWQEIDFSQAVAIQANTTYVVSYLAPSGHYSFDSSYFASAGVDSGVLHALSNAAAGGNGVFVATTTGAFPNSNFNATNYWVDVVFSSSLAPAVTATTPAAGAGGVGVGTAVTATFSRPLNPTTVTTSTFHMRAAGATSDVPATVSYAGLTATLQPGAPLAVNTTYTVTVSGSITGADGTPVGSDFTWSFTTQPYPTVTDTTAADFAAGTPDANTAVVQTGDGEVALAPTEGAEFSGTALPADWTSTPWASGGAATVAGGRMTVDGTLARATGVYTRGRSLEFVATFSGDGFEHAGLSVDLSAAPWAMFSTMSGGALYARTNNGISSTDTPIPGSWLGTPHDFRIDWATTGFTYWIDGIQVASHPIGITASMRPLASDATVGAGAVTVDWVRLTPYAGSGTFLSRVLDAGATVAWLNATWSASVPAGTSLALSVRTGNTPVPDSTWTAFTPLASSGSAVGRSSRYLQYQASLAATDPGQTPALQAVTFQYSANSPPVASNDAYSTAEDNPLTVAAPGVLANDTDPDGNSLTVALVSGPAHGTLTLNATGGFTYTPAANYNGSDSFTYKANDGQLDSNVATVSLTVTTVNDPPAAGNDSYTTAEDTPLTVSAPGVLGNDTDVDGDPLTAVLVSGPSHGTLTLNSTGGFTYTPAANYNGSDSFTYKANDGQADSNVATVSLTVTPVNDPPVASNDTYGARKNVTLNAAAPGVLGNDTDVDGDPLTAVLVSGPSHGTLTLNANGSFTYTPATDYTGSDSFTYKDSDGQAFSNVATVSLTVTAPVASNDSYGARKNVTLTVAAPGVLGNDTDAGGFSLTAALVSGPAHGTLTLNANGSFTYVPATDYTGTDSFTYQASGGGTTSNVATVSLNVTAPVATNDVYGARKNVALTVAAPGVLGNDTDAGGFSLSAVLVSGPAHGTVTLNADGSFTYTPATDYTGSDSFTYKDSGGGTTSNVATASFNVTAPVATNDSYGARKNIPLTVAAPGVLGNDTDAGGFSLSAALVSGPAHGTVTLNADGSFTYTPATDYTGSDSFTYRDSGGGTTSNVATVSFNVTAPVASNDVYGARKNIPLTVAAPGVLGNDTDAGGFSLSAALVSGPAHGTVTLNADGSFTYTPATDYTGADSFTYRDSGGGTTSNVATVSFNVTAPVAVNKSYSTVEEKALSVAASGVLTGDTDAGGFSLSAVLVSGPAHGTLTLNADGSFAYTPAAGYAGSDSFTYKDSGGGTFSNVATVALTVTAPTLSINDVKANSGLSTTTFTFTVTLSSPISQPVTVNYTTANGTAMAPADYFSASGTLTFAPGQTSQTVNVMVTPHPLPGSNLTFYVLLFVPSNATLARATGTGTIVPGNLQMLDGEAVTPGPGVQPLTQQQLAPAVTEATALWAAAGADTALLSGIQIRITDLPGADLGAEAPGVIWIDVNAAGHGWFIDANPADPVPANRVDLLTVVAHELGHVLGLPDDPKADPYTGGLMALLLPVGVRKIQLEGLLPSAGSPAPAPQGVGGAWLATGTAQAGGAPGGALPFVGPGPVAVSGGGLTPSAATVPATAANDPAPVVGQTSGTADPWSDPLGETAVVDQLFAAWGAAQADPFSLPPPRPSAAGA